MVTYRHFGVIGGWADGYRETKLRDGSWQVTAIIRRSKPVASAAKMALYRAAEIAEASEQKNVNILSVKQGVLSSYSGSIGFATHSTLELVFTVTNTENAGSHCANGVQISCVTYDAKAALTELRPFLKFDKGN
ncbi:MAG: hypothetical protein K2Y20_10590 [Sphingomonas sp.]|nr:hypothetical protein [Sphingomonas sp.]